jgi:hypothetical protein
MTDKFTGESYEIIAWANNQEVVFYEMFGTYDGEWLLVSEDETNFILYKDWYGSCSYCDPYEDEIRDINLSKKKALEFANKYKPFLEIPKEIAFEVCKRKDLKSLLPANIRSGNSWPDDATINKIELAILNTY